VPVDGKVEEGLTAYTVYVAPNTIIRDEDMVKV
jgi:hypothetical protein